MTTPQRNADELPRDQHELLPEIAEWRDRAARAGDMDTVFRIEGWADRARHQAITLDDIRGLRADAADRRAVYELPDRRGPDELDEAIGRGEDSAETRAHTARRHAADTRSPMDRAADDRRRSEAGTFTRRYAAVMEEADRERAQRADPDLARLIDARDYDAAGGRFELADSSQRLIDSIHARQSRPRHETPPHERQGRTRSREHVTPRDRERRGAVRERDYPPITRGRVEGGR